MFVCVHMWHMCVCTLLRVCVKVCAFIWVCRVEWRILDVFLYLYPLLSLETLHLELGWWPKVSRNLSIPLPPTSLGLQVHVARPEFLYGC